MMFITHSFVLFTLAELGTGLTDIAVIRNASRPAGTWATPQERLSPPSAAVELNETLQGADEASPETQAALAGEGVPLVADWAPVLPQVRLERLQADLRSTQLAKAKIASMEKANKDCNRKLKLLRAQRAAAKKRLREAEAKANALKVVRDQEDKRVAGLPYHVFSAYQEAMAQYQLRVRAENELRGARKARVKAEGFAESRLEELQRNVSFQRIEDRLRAAEDARAATSAARAVTKERQQRQKVVAEEAKVEATAAATEAETKKAIADAQLAVGRTADTAVKRQRALAENVERLEAAAAQTQIAFETLHTQELQSKALADDATEEAVIARHRAEAAKGAALSLEHESAKANATAIRTGLQAAKAGTNAKAATSRETDAIAAVPDRRNYIERSGASLLRNTLNVTAREIMAGRSRVLATEHVAENNPAAFLRGVHDGSREQANLLHQQASLQELQASNEALRLTKQSAPGFELAVEGSDIGKTATNAMQKNVMAQIVIGHIYDSKDANGAWWPITVTAKNDDDTFAATVHDDVGSVWPSVLLKNIRNHEMHVEVGDIYESKDAEGTWWPVTITAKNDDATFVATVHDDVSSKWPSVLLKNIRDRSI